jgi:4-hydroxy-2-oxoglutarate aldolase
VTNPTLDLRGIFPPIPTPFTTSEALDHDALRCNLAFLEKSDLRGYVVMGSNGEAVHLSYDERFQLIEDVRGLLPDHRLLIAGTGCPSTRETIVMSRRAASLGADAVLVLPPHYYRGRMTHDALVRHFRAVADACSVPVILYNMPACTGIDMGAPTILAAAEHENIIGLKDSGGDITKLGAIYGVLGDRFQLLAGSASFLLPARSVGAVGGVLALANIAPDLCIEIQRSVDAGDWMRAREIQVRLIEPNRAVTQRWGVAGLKAAMDLLGLCGGCVRRPLLDLTAPEVDELKAILSAADILPTNTLKG